MAASEPDAPKPTSGWLRRHWAPIVTLVFFFGVLPGALAAIALHCPMINIVDSNFSVQPGNYAEYSFTETSSGNHGLYGSFSSSIPVYLYVMSATQFSSFSSSKVANSTILSVGPLTSYSFPETCVKGCFPTFFVQQGTYYLVFNNPNNSAEAAITITWQIHADSC